MNLTKLMLVFILASLLAITLFPIITSAMTSDYNLTYDTTKNTVQLFYDSNNRISNKTTASDLITYVYDADMNDTLTNITNNNVSIKYEYDSRKRIIKEQRIIDGFVFKKESNYDSMDRVKSYALPDSKEINFSYNAQGLISSILDIITSIFYNENNQLIEKVYENNLDTNYSYNIDNFRLSRIKTADIQDLNYAYDYAGNVKNINDTANSRKFYMDYDNIDRLISTNIINYSSEEDKNLTFTYNEIGNMLNISINNENITFYYNESLAHAPIRITHVTPTIGGIPQISFVTPTPANGTNQSSNAIFVNVSSYVSSGEHSVLLDWNSTLVLWYRFNPDTLINDSSGNNYHGSLSGAIYTSSGKYGGAYSFDGINDEINTNVDLSWSNISSFSFEIWIKPNNLIINSTYSQYILGKSDWEYLVYLNNESHKVVGADGRTQGSDSNTPIQQRFGFIYWGLNGVINDSIDINTNITTVTVGNWYHIVVVYNRSLASLYVNGILEGTDVVDGTFKDRTDNMTIGRGTSGGGVAYFNGTLDEVQIYSRALTEEEINASYNANLYKYYHNFTNLAAGNYVFKAYAQDLAGNLNQTEERAVTIQASTPKINLDLINPTPGTSRVNVTQNQFFNVTVNVSCLNADCGEINVSLDPQTEERILISNTRTANTETFCYDDGKCTKIIYSANKFIETEEGNNNWTEFWNVVKITRTNDIFNISYHNKWVTFKPYFVRNGINYTWQQVKNSYPELSIDFYKIDYPYYTKWGFNLSNPQNRTFDYLNIKLEEAFGLIWDDIRIEDENLIIKDKIALGFSDIKQQGYILNLVDRKTARIGNVSGKLNIDIDPVISLTSGNILADIYYEATTNEGTLMKYDISSIPDVSTINNATLCLAIHSVQGTIDNDLTVWYINNQTWLETDNAATINSMMAKLNETNATHSNWTAAGAWDCFNVTTQLRQSYSNNNKNFTLRLEDPDYLSGGTVDFVYNGATLIIGDVLANTISFNSSEANINTPYLNITYTPTLPQISFVAPTPSSGTNTTNNHTINITINHGSYTINNFNWSWNNGTQVNTSFYDSDLVLMYNFGNLSSLGENATLSVDISKYSNNGTINGSTWTSSGRYGGAYQFDGIANTGNNIRVNNTAGQVYNNTPISISMWYYKAGLTATTQTLFSHPTAGTPGNRITWSHGAGDNFMDVRFGNQTTVNVFNCNLNTWCYFVSVSNMTDYKAWGNGVSVTGWIPYSKANNMVDVVIGALNITGFQGFNGTIDEVRVYNRTLTDNEILQMYKSNLQKFNLTHWEFISNQSNLIVGTNYTYFATAWDTAGNSNSTKTRWLNITTQGTAKGLISTTTGTTPFYTNESNPRTINLNNSQSQILTFWVNATGNIGNNYTFFVFANKTSQMSISNMTNKWNVTII